MDRLNYFAPYQSKAEHHEDNLTRAFMVVLRYVPLAQAAFVELLREKLGDSRELLAPFHSGDSALEKILTQVGQVPSEDVSDLVSIIMTEEHWTKDVKIGIRETDAIYDGIVQFGSTVFTIENKPCSKNIWEGQLSPHLDEDNGINIHSKAVDIYWPEVISSLASLVSRGLLGPCSLELVKDFLAFVQDNFPLLNPYDSLDICGDNEALVRLRCKGILEEIAPDDVKYHRGADYYIAVEADACKQIPLHFLRDRRVIALLLYPGDTMSQAKALYRKLDQSKLRTLEKLGWKMEPNLHFSHIQRHEHWSGADIDLEQYIDYWKNNPDRITQVNRNESGNFDPYLEELLSLNMINAKDKERLRQIFNESNRAHIRPCPGVQLKYEWSLTDAAALDKAGKFKDEVKDKIKEGLSAWGQTF